MLWFNTGGDLIRGDDALRPPTEDTDRDLLQIGTLNGTAGGGLNYSFFLGGSISIFNADNRFSRATEFTNVKSGNGFNTLPAAMDYAAETDEFTGISYGFTGFQNMVAFNEIERVNMFGTDAHGDLMIHQGGSFYFTGESFGDLDTFVGDFSDDVVGIDLQIGDGSVTQSLANGITLGGIDRLVLKAGSGDDIIYGGEFGDYIRGGVGVDRLWGGEQDDELYGDDGNDIIYWATDGVDFADGGAGLDRLIISGAGETLGVRLDGTDFNTGLISALGLDALLSSIGSATTVEILGSTFSFGQRMRIEIENIEFVDLLGGENSSDLIIYSEGELYSGGGGTGVDLFVADLSAETVDLYFDINYESGNAELNSTDAVLVDHYDFGLGAFIGGFERLALSLGSGDDRVIGGEQSEFIRGGAGNDYLQSGGALLLEERLFGDGGQDTIVYQGGDVFIDGGSGAALEWDIAVLHEATNALQLDLMDAGRGIIRSFTAAQLATYAEMENLFNETVTFALPTATGFAFSEAFGNSMEILGIESVKLNGSDFADVLIATNLRSELQGNDGDDVLISGFGTDLLLGGAGVDRYVFDDGFGTDRIAGETVGGGELFFVDQTFSDLAFNIQGNNLIVTGTGGNVTIANYFAGGGNGLAFRFVTSDSDSVLDLSGLGAPGGGSTLAGLTFGGTINADTINGSAGNDTLGGLEGNDIFNGSGGFDIFNGGAGEDMVSYADIDSAITVDLLFYRGTGGAALGDTFFDIEHIVAGQQSAFISGDHNNNYLVGSPVGDFRLEGRRGDDVIIGLEGNDDLRGDEGDDSLFGDEGEDTLDGFFGNDQLQGGAGNDTATGGLGEDLYIYGGDDDPTTAALEDGFDTFDGGTGVDAADFTEFDYAITANMNSVTNTVFTRFDDFSDPANGPLTAIATLQNIEELRGSFFNDRLSGSSSANSLRGSIGDDTLVGRAGNDTLLGDEGTDVVDYSADGGAGALNITMSSDLDVVTSVIDTHGDTDMLLGVEGIFGTANDDTIVMDSADNIIEGRNGDDVLTGLGGNDTIVGGAGADTMSGGEGVDTLSYKGSTVSLFVGLLDRTLVQQGGVAIDTAFGFENVIGSTVADGLYGDHGNNALLGEGGNDTLFGNMGSDDLDGGAGDDTITAGAPGDVFVRVGTQDISTQALAQDLDDFFGLQDVASIDNATTRPHASVFGSAPVGERDTYLFTATAGSVISADIDRTNPGTDLRLTLFDSDFTQLTLNQDNGGDFGSSTSLDPRINSFTAPTDGTYYVQVTQSDGFGFQQATEYVLNIGVDNHPITFADTGSILIGGSGVDSMTGNAGNDTFYIDTLADVIVEGVGQGTDTVVTTVTYALAANLENVTLAGSVAINAGGNAADNMLVGNAAGNVLNGGQGDDTLMGAAGADTLNGGAGIDEASYLNSRDGVSAFMLNSAAATGDALGDVYNGVENLAGTTRDDDLRGDNDANVIRGFRGNDLLVGNGGDDTLQGEAQNDTLQGNAGVDALYGGSNTDLLILNAGDDTLGEIFDGGTEATGEADTLRVATGSTGTPTTNLRDDTITDIEALEIFGQSSSITQINYAQFADAGITTISASPHAGQTVRVQVYTDTATNLRLDQLAVSGFDQPGDLIVTVGDGDAENITGSNVGDFIQGFGGADLIDGAGGDDTVQGGTGDDTVRGAFGDDSVDGGADSDTVEGGFGDDTLNGGIGNDTLDGQQGDDVLFGSSGGDEIHGGSGNDTISYGGDVIGVVIDLGNLDASGGNAQGDQFRSVENVIGSQGGDGITGDLGNNVLQGFGGDDVIIGGGGSDRIEGGGGNDTLESGVNSIVLRKEQDTQNATSATAVSVDGFFGTFDDPTIEDATTRPHATVYGDAHGGLELYSFTVTGASPGSPVTGVFDIDRTTGGVDSVLRILDTDGVTQIARNDDNFLVDAGSADFQDSQILQTFTVDGVYFVEVANFLGGPGDRPITAGESYALHVSLDNAAVASPVTVSLLDGGTGADSMTGGLGVDNFLVDDLGDVAEDVAGGLGDDNVQSSVTHTLSQFIENLQMTGFADANGTGNTLDNSIFGNDGNNILSGLGGNDFIAGSNGNDTELGGAGDDTIIGNAFGDDSLDGGADTDLLNFEFASEGVTASLGATGAQVFRAGLGSDTVSNIENLDGSQQADTLFGSAGNNVINGLGGSDTIAGGAGDDMMDGGAGFDLLNYFFASGGVTVDLTNQGTAQAVGGGQGTDTFMSFVDVNGSNTGNDSITGDAQSNFLFGFGGNDTLNGGAGSDQLTGGAGLDLLDGGINSDILVGGAGNDTLLGGGGDDNLRGDGGNDSLVGDIGSDTASYILDTAGVTVNLTQSGFQNISAAQGFDLLSGIENVEGGAGNDTLTGDSGANRLGGNNGNDSFVASAGADTIQGGAGFDTLNYFGASGAITVDLTNTGAQTIGGGFGTQTIDEVEQIFGSFAGGDSITGDGSDERFVGFGGADTLEGGGGNDSLDGGGDNDSLRGDGGNDLLDGGVGNDTLVGGENNDTLRGGAGNDVFFGGLGFDVVDYSTAGDGITVSLASGAIQNVSVAQGNDFLDNIEGIFGSAQNDFLFGDDNANLIGGGNGIDRIAGAGGDDTLNGGGNGDAVNYFFATGAVTVDLGQQGSVQAIGGGQGSDLLGGFENILGSQTFGDDLDGDGAGNRIAGYGGDDTIDGNNGNDVLFGANGADLLRGGMGDDQIIAGNGNDTLGGNDGADTLNGGTGADVLFGGAGADLLFGGLGGDLMTGGAGADVFLFTAVTDSVLPVANRDVIADFATGVDTLDLSGIDANTGVAGNQAFSFIGSAGFSAVGQVRLVVSGTDGFLLGDLDGDGLADLNIQLSNVSSLTGADFIL